MKKRVTVKTNKFVLLIVAFLFLTAIARLIYVSISSNIDGINLKKFASSRNTTKKELYASRGTIYDSNNDALALSVNSYTLIAYLSEKRTIDENNPMHVVDKDYTAEKLAEILKADKKDILKYLNKDAYQVEFGTIGKDLTETVKKKIDDLELPGIDFITGNQRYYKMGDFASYIIGYAKRNEESGEITGELGLESYYNKELSGKDGYIEYQRDAKGYALPNTPTYTVEAVSGSDLYLTIDSNVQLITENALTELKNEYESEWAIFTVMDAKTGAIVASSTYPSFNPNDLNTLTSYLNPLVSYEYEPGSTMKTFSWSSAVEEGWYKGSDTFKSGSIDVADVTIKDVNKVGWGTISYDTGFAYSSNVGATNLALKLGTEKLSYYYDRFGFGKKTGIELSGEVNGNIKMKYKSELATAAFGQGITVTPIQLMQAYTSIVNDGIMLKPYVVKKIVNSKGQVTYEGKKEEIGRVMTRETSQKMQELMTKVNYEGLYKMWQPTTVSMMIKTGTAQMPSPKGGYLTGDYDYILSLAGIFPVENPKYIIYIAVSKLHGPQKAIANAVVKAVDSIASYAKITETEKEISDTSIITLDNYSSKNISEVKENLEKIGIKVITIGSGKYIINQYPKDNTKIVKNSKVFLVTNSEEYLMPNILSWSISDVLTYAKLTGIKVEYEGYGYVYSQSIAENTKFKKDDVLKVSLISKEQQLKNEDNNETKEEDNNP